MGRPLAMRLQWNGDISPEARYDVLANLLWPRRADLRLVSLMPWSPYAVFDQGERRGLVAEWVPAKPVSRRCHSSTTACRR